MTAPLFDPGAGKLRERQQVALNFLGREGATALDVGRNWHAHIGCMYCSPDHDCIYVESAGRSVLVSLRKKRLVVRRRSGIWQRVDTKPAETAGLQGDLPENF